MDDIYTVTIGQASETTGLSKTWLIKLCQRGEVGKQQAKNCTWTLSEKDIAYLIKRKSVVRPGRPSNK